MERHPPDAHSCSRPENSALPTPQQPPASRGSSGRSVAATFQGRSSPALSKAPADRRLEVTNDRENPEEPPFAPTAGSPLTPVAAKEARHAGVGDRPLQSSLVAAGPGPPTTGPNHDPAPRR